MGLRQPSQLQEVDFLSFEHNKTHSALEFYPEPLFTIHIKKANIIAFLGCMTE